MVKVLKQFIIRKLREPVKKNVDEDIEWVCNSLGFIGLRDQGKTAFGILKALIESAKEGKGLTSEELTKKVQPTIGSVIYHLNKLMKAGLVIKIDSRYELKMRSITSTIEEIENDIRFTLANIKKVALDVDNKIGLENR